MKTIKTQWVKNKHEMYAFEEFDGSCPNQIEVITKEDMLGLIDELIKEYNEGYITLALEELKKRING